MWTCVKNYHRYSQCGHVSWSTTDTIIVGNTMNKCFSTPSACCLYHQKIKAMIACLFCTCSIVENSKCLVFVQNLCLQERIYTCLFSLSFAELWAKGVPQTQTLDSPMVWMKRLPLSEGLFWTLMLKTKHQISFSWKIDITLFIFCNICFH